MANLVIGSTTVISDSSGSPTFQSSGVNYPTGHVIQVVGKTITATTISHTDTFSDWVAIEGGSDATNFHVDISPKQASSNFHIVLHTSIGGESSAEGAILLRRGYDSSGGTSFSYTDIKGDASGSCTRSTYYSAFDIGGTGESTGALYCKGTNVWDTGVSYAVGGKFRYKVYWRNPGNTSGNLYLNRSYLTDTAERATGISSIVVQEIAG